MSGNIVWLASYPKSGNTWFRIILSNLLYGEEKPVDINHMIASDVIYSSSFFLNEVGIEPQYLTHSEVERLRRMMHIKMSENSIGIRYAKVHDSYHDTDEGLSLFPSEASRAVIYLVRNPLDVCVSYAHHLGDCSYESVISRMNDDEEAYCEKINKYQNLVRQKLKSWSSHVTSWLQQTQIPVVTIKYEELHTDPLEAIRRATRVIGINCSERDIENALGKSRFDAIRTQEISSGFREKPVEAASFFRKGKVGDWKSQLTKKQADRLISHHESVMRKINYIQ